MSTNGIYAGTDAIWYPTMFIYTSRRCFLISNAPVDYVIFKYKNNEDFMINSQKIDIFYELKLFGQ